MEPSIGQRQKEEIALSRPMPLRKSHADRPYMKATLMLANTYVRMLKGRRNHGAAALIPSVWRARAEHGGATVIPSPPFGLSLRLLSFAS